VPPNVPNRSELYVTPETLRSSEAMSDVLVACASLAAEAGAGEIRLPCPSDCPLDPTRLDIIDRRFAFAWLRKRL